MTTATVNEPVPGYDSLKTKLSGYDALSSDEVLAALEAADVGTIKRVRGYERKFRARREVLDEVDRLHRERRLPLVSRDAKRQ
jgi:hypothetical protein